MDDPALILAKSEADALVQLLERPGRRAYVLVITISRDAKGNGMGTISRSVSADTTNMDARVILQGLDQDRARVSAIVGGDAC